MADAPTWIIIHCKITPNAAISAFVGWSVDELGRRLCLIKLAAPPVDGKANAALLRFCADSLKCARSQVTLLLGATSRIKTVQLPSDAASRIPV